ncbi:MAG: phage baseplate assembly protein V [Anaerolineae bacterium]
MTEQITGVVIGLVTDVEDPEGLGRVRVEFPWLSDSNVSNWARVATSLAGPELGHFFQPEIGDEALVAFEMGDVQHPYILGYLWNGDNAPPSDDPSVRMIQSVAGHKLVFTDTSGEEGVLVEDSNGNKIEMNADGILMEDANGNKVEMTSSGITIESSGDITIKGTNVTIEASAKLAATGNPIHLNP